MKYSKSKTVILVPRLDNAGGVANYYSALRPFLSKNIMYINRGKTNKSNDIRRLISDFLLFNKQLKNNAEIRSVIINSSLGWGGTIRDGCYNLLNRKGVKIIVFFRGWNPSFENNISNSKILRYWLKNTFLRANHIIVLSSQFKNKLREWGYQGPITIETTAVDDRLVEGFTLHKSRAQKPQSPYRLLYLGSISKTKGVWEILGAFTQLIQFSNTPETRLTMAGGGSDAEKLKEYALNNDLPITFPGYVRDKKKAETYTNSHLYVFASYHEGMPNSVLEAMAFGLPIITSRVGGIPDFFEDGKMGLFLDNRDPEHIAEKIQYLLDRPELMKQISKYNYNYAKEHFYASKVARRLEGIIDQVASS